MMSGYRIVWPILAWLFLITLPVHLRAEVDMDGIEGAIICTCGCPNMILITCICGHAEEMRAEIQALIDEGNNEEEIIRVLIERYGERILAEPIAEGFNLVAYVAPFFMLMLGGGFLFILIKRWKRNSGGVVEDRITDPESGGDDPYREKLEKELDAFKE